MNIQRVANAIDQAIASFRTEREGLSQRLDDVTSRAAIVAGNGSDDYLTRETAVSQRLTELDTEVKNAQRRINQLAHNISQFESLREEFRARTSEPERREVRRAEPRMPAAAAS